MTPPQQAVLYKKFPDGSSRALRLHDHSHGNAWDAAAVGIGGSSAVIDTQDAPNVSVFGNVDAATDIDVAISQDGINFYVVATISLAGAGDFAEIYQIGARYVQLTSSAAATITATVAAE